VQQDPPLAGTGVGRMTSDQTNCCLPEAYPPVFCQEKASLLALEEQGIPPEDRLAWSTLRRWEQRARLLHELSGCALRNGHALEAADYKEAANRLEGWIASLFKLLTKRRSRTAEAG